MDERVKYRIINALRQVSRFTPMKTEAKRRALMRLEIGKTKAGKPKYRNFYKCAKCKGLFKDDEIHVDHIEPVIDPVEGFRDWNTYMARLFCDYNGLQVLCIPHHEEKTKSENERRKAVKSARKIKKTKKKR